MQYFGGKVKIAKQLSQFIKSQLKEKQTFVDLFCGSCNIISKVDSNRQRIANDKHYYLIEMLKKFQNGWVPFDYLSKEEYYFFKESQKIYPYIAGFVGFGCSFAGKWWGGYAKNSTSTNYCLQAKTSMLKKMSTMQDVLFRNKSYNDLEIPKNSFVYCDIPYKNSTTYCVSEVGKFNHDEFYRWVLDNKDNFTCYISEYKENIPDGFKIVWELESKKSIRNKDYECKKTTEVLIVLK